MCANGLAPQPRCCLAESACPDSTAETVDGLHTDESDAETMVEMATRGLTPLSASTKFNYKTCQIGKNRRCPGTCVM